MKKIFCLVLIAGILIALKSALEDDPIVTGNIHPVL